MPGSKVGSAISNNVDRLASVSMDQLLETALEGLDQKLLVDVPYKLPLAAAFYSSPDMLPAD